MEFFNSAVGVLQTLVVALGAGLGIWGAINLLEGYSKKFFEEHRQEITIHKAAKQAFDEAQITKLPSMQSLYEEFHRLTVQKKQDYAEYRKIRKEKEELLIAKQTVETILNIDKKKEQEQEKKSVR